MENPNTWTLLHHDLNRASNRVFQSAEQKAEVLVSVLENHRIPATKEEVSEVINDFCARLESGMCGKSLIATVVDAFQTKE